MLFTFWHGPLTWFERVCLASAAATGHKLTVYSYEPLSGLPPGVTTGNANDVIPANRMFLARNGSLAMFSDLFRYEGLRRGLGTWIDADMMLFKPLSDLGETIVCWGRPGEINNAVLRLPPDHPFLAKMKRLTEAWVPIPFHWTRKQKLKQIKRALRLRPKPLHMLDPYDLGPRAITSYFRTHGLEHQVLPQDVLFPLIDIESEAAFDPAGDIESRFTAATQAVHLCNSKVRHHKNKPPRPGSFMARMCEKYGITAQRSPTHST